MLPRQIMRRVVTEPPSAELWRNGQGLGKTPVEIELPRFDEAAYRCPARKGRWARVSTTPMTLVARSEP